MLARPGPSSLRLSSASRCPAFSNSLSFSRPSTIANRHHRFQSRSSDEDDAAVAVAEPSGSLFEVTKDNFWEYLKADEQKGMLIVVDCYTEWCGPCKMIYPSLVELSKELEPEARIVKFNCNKANKELGVELKIKVAPTFLLFKDAEKVGEMTGAKLEKLKSLIADKLEPVTNE